MNIEALAHHLAWGELYDYVMGDRWYGSPDPDNADEMETRMQVYLPSARERAQEYANILTEDADDKQ